MLSEEEYTSRIRNSLIEKLEYKDDVTDDELKEMIGEEIKELNLKCHIPIKDRLELGKQIFHSMRKLDILQDLLEDSGITEIMVNGPNNIFIEKKGRLQKVSQGFEL